MRHAFIGLPETSIQGGSLEELSLVGGDVLRDPAHVLLQLVAQPVHRLHEGAEHARAVEISPLSSPGSLVPITVFDFEVQPGMVSCGSNSKEVAANRKGAKAITAVNYVQ